MHYVTGVDYGAAFGNNEEDGDSGEDSDDDKNLDKYKKLLTDLNSQENKKKHDVEMEISWEPGIVTCILAFSHDYVSFIQGFINKSMDNL